MDPALIVVGMDGSSGSWQALGWAATEARSTGRNLLVAYLSEAAEHLGDYGFGSDLANKITCALEREHPSLLAHTVLIDGDPVEFLLRATAEAAMLVLGREPSTSSLLSLSPILAGVLARCDCPVVVVGGPAADLGAGAGRIVLGVSDSTGGRSAMRFAGEQAARAGGAVLAVRSTCEFDRQAAETSSPQAPPASQGHEEHILDACLDEAHARFPGVDISGLLTAEAVRSALARQSHDASLVVLGCGPSDDSLGPRPGAGTLIAVYGLPCPVAVVGPGQNSGGHLR